MRKTGKIDYLELPSSPDSLAAVKQFYTAAFGWSFTDYGPAYSAFDEGLQGGFDASAPSGDDNSHAGTKPLPVLYSDDLEATLAAVEQAGGAILLPIFSFPGGRRFHFSDPSGNELAVWSEADHDEATEE